MKQFPIAIILPSFASGGAERVIISLVENIDNNIFDTHLIMQNTHGPLKCNISKNRIKDLGFSRFRYVLPALIKTINNIKPAIVLSTFPHITILLLMFKNFFYKDVLIICREPNMPSSSLNHSQFSFIIKNLYNIYMPRINGVISTSVAMKNELISRGINQNKITVISNPINMNRLKNFKTVQRYKGEGLRLVFVGRLEYQKGLDRLLPLLKNIHNIHLTIIGVGKEKNKLKKIVEKINIREKVKFLGHMDFPYPYMAGADFFILPSRWEGLPNVVLESLSLGTPVITMKEIKGLDEIKNQTSSDNLLFCEDSKKLQSLLLKLQARKDYKRPIIRKSILRKYYTPEQYAKKVSDFIKKIIHEN